MLLKKYGAENFEYYLVERFDESDNLEQILAERELYWINELNSLDKEKGYNLRYDSKGKCFCSDETREKISKRAKKDWENGCYSDHSNKLKNYWANCSEERKEQQRKIMSKNKTKYTFIIYDPNGKLITEDGTIETLKKLELDKSAYSAFSKKKSNDVITKKYRVIRINNKDIVQPDEKLSDC